jgi:hypothetical protein
MIFHRLGDKSNIIQILAAFLQVGKIRGTDTKKTKQKIKVKQE